MKCWKVIAAMVVLGLWAVCSTSCAFETFSLSKSLVCCAEKSESEPVPEGDCPCTCGVLVSGIFLPQTELWTHDCALDSVDPLPPAAPETFSAGAALENGSPPEFVHTWHFSLRAAPQPRAPSAAA